MDDVLIIGIAGGTGSGKTTITKLLEDKFGDSVSVIYHDDYYRSHDNMTYEERTKINYDCPDALETDLLVEDLTKLKQGLDVLCPTYDYSVHNRSGQMKLVKSAPVIVCDGILLFENKALRDTMDIKIFVDTDADVRILRRIMRDVKERGRSLDSVVTQYLTTVKPMHEMYVEPSKRFADIIVPEGGHNVVAVSMLMERIRAHINSYEKEL